MASKLTVTVSESTTNSNEIQCCWICFGTNKEDLLAEWVGYDIYFATQFIRKASLGATMQVSWNCTMGASAVFATLGG